MDQPIYSISEAVEEGHWWFVGRRAVIDALVTRAGLKPGARTLDVGCGTGRNLEIYGRLGAVAGVDPAPEAIEICRRRGLAGVVRADACDLPFPADSFDLLAATDVIEHVPDDVAALAEMRRVAAPGATLLITVPAYQWMWSAEDERLHHFRRYTLPRLRAAVSEAGWSPGFGTYFNSLLLGPIALARKLRSGRASQSEIEATPATVNRLLVLPIRMEARLIGAGVRIPAGVSVGLLSRRR